jgi:hypothetical protein
MISDRREHYYDEVGIVLQGFGSTTPVTFGQAATPLTAAKPDPIMRETELAGRL